MWSTHPTLLPQLGLGLLLYHCPTQLGSSILCYQDSVIDQVDRPVQELVDRGGQALPGLLTGKKLPGPLSALESVSTAHDEAQRKSQQ